MNKVKQNPNLAIKLDTNLKQISIDRSVNLEELYKNIKKLLPDGCPFGSYKEYEIVANSVFTYYPTNWWEVNTCYAGDNLEITATNSYTTSNNDGSFTVNNAIEQPKEEKGIFYIQMETQIG